MLKGSCKRARCHRILSVVGALVLAQLGASVLASSQGLGQIDSVQSEWRVHGGTPAEQRHSQLTHIDRGNVSRLGPAWHFEFDNARGLEATPLVVNGVLYTTGAWSHVYAFDAKTGGLLWHHDPKVP
ncbi:MAG: PQQ-dependent dehydrogenase, methanol/ethanol family, partial [Rhodobacteraceae bacterium]|nr:PQQ-dependent dehydrogenase, methanol/ethanol family [Paracoccaceae bacterium]